MGDLKLCALFAAQSFSKNIIECTDRYTHTHAHAHAHFILIGVSCLKIQMFRWRIRRCVGLVAEQKKQRHLDIENAFKIIASFKLVFVHPFVSRIKQRKIDITTNANVDPLKDELYCYLLKN